MSIVRKYLSLSLGAASLAVVAGTAQAAAVSTASLDLSSASITYLSGSGSISTGPSVTSVTGFTGGSFYGQGGGSTSATWSGLGLSGNASGGSSGVTAHTNAAYSSSPPNPDSVKATADTWETLTLAANAIVDIRVPYTLSVSTTQSIEDGWAQGQLLVSINTANVSKTFSSTELLSNTGNVSDTLELILANRTGAAENLSIDVNATSFAQSGVSAVPIPGALLLFGSGIVGLASASAFRRRNAVR